ncbi:MAG: hypothetical protein ACFFB7_06355 [Candidatus Sifarchaeia archaeon]
MQIELWQVHAGTMTTAIILLILAVVIARFMRQRRWWLRVHRAISTLGAVVGVGGFTVAFYMVSLGGGVHFFYPHTWVGAASLVLAVVTALSGYGRARLGLSRERYLLVHRLLAVLTIVLMAIAIVLGLGLVYGF